MEKFDIGKQIDDYLGDPVLPKKIFNPIVISNSGKCARLLWYRYNNYKEGRYVWEPEPWGKRFPLILEAGDFYEQMIIRLMKRAGIRFRCFQHYVTFKAAGYPVNGYIDAITQKGPCIVDFKSANNRRFTEMINNGPSYEYRCQLVSYMDAMEIHDSALVVINKDTQDIITIPVEYSKTTVEEIQGRWCKVIEGHKHGRPFPDREYYAEPETEWVRGKKDLDAEKLDNVVEVKQNGYRRKTGRSVLPWECVYCEMRKHCWSDAKQDGKQWVVPCNL